MASGGAQRLLVNLVQELSALELDVSVFLYNQAKIFPSRISKAANFGYLCKKEMKWVFALSVCLN